MQGLNSRTAPRPALHPLVAAIAIICGGCAGALWSGAAFAADDPNPYYIGVTEGITHDTNINRIPGGAADTYSSTGLVGGFDQLIGRQHVYGSANAALNRYRDDKALNNTSYSLNAGLDWQTVNQFSGKVYTSFTQGLANLNNNILQTSTEKNLVKTDSLGTRVSWGGASYLSLTGGYGYSRTTFSAPSLQASDSNQSTADIGVNYIAGPTLTLGTALRFTKSNADRAYQLQDGTYLSNRTNGRNLDFTASWHPTVQSGVNARISFTNQTGTSTGDQGFSGLTGSLGFTYAPTGKLSFNGEIDRDAATNGNFYNTFNGTTSQTTVGLAESSSVANSLNLGVAYAATAKINVTAGVQYRRTTQADSGSIAAGNFAPGYRDAYTSESLGANWSITRNWSLGCTVSHVNRKVDGAFADDYSGTAYGCVTQLTLR